MPKSTSMQMTRREVMNTAVATIAMAGLPDWYSSAALAAEQERDSQEPKRFGTNDQINVAVIGPGGKKGGFRQGLGDAHSAARKPGVKVIAACDVDRTHAEDAARSFGPDCKTYYDFREVLARPDIDAVVIGVPDHWHAIVSVAAMKAGKDVYCEKPMTLRIDEGKKVVKTAREKQRIFQTGSQQRSDSRFRLACELVRNGRIGKLKRAIAHLPTGPAGGPFKALPVPSDFDFEFWLGPAPVADYFPDRTHGSFRYWLDYSGGMLTDWGAHHNDIAQWGIGADASGPISVEAVGRAGMVGKNCYNTFPEFDITYQYENGTTLLTTNKGENGVDFEGETGSIFVSRGEIRASDPQLLVDPLPATATRLYVSNDHMQNWIDGIRTRTQTICNPEVGHRSVTTCHLANISLRLGGKFLEWDPKKERFKNSHEANEMMKYHYRGGWKL